MNKKASSCSLTALFLFMLIFFSFSFAVSKPVSAAYSVDEVDLYFWEQVEKNCPEKTNLATTKEQDFAACVQAKFTPCTVTRPDDPFSCVDPAVAQCRSILDVFLTTCGAAVPACLEKEELKDGACVCKQGYDRVDGVCASPVGGHPVPTEVIEFRVMNMTVKSMKGDVRLQHRGKGDTEAKSNETITEGDEIFTGFDSHVVLVSDQGDVILLKAGSQIRIATKNEKLFEIKLEKGEVKYEYKSTGPTRPDVRIVSPTATASVRGTVFIVRAMETGISEVLVSKGVVLVTHNATGKESTVSAGQKLTATTDDVSAPEPLTIQDKERFADKTVLKNRKLFYGMVAISVLVFLGILITLIKRQRR